jgi:hypothetical protein
VATDDADKPVEEPVEQSLADTEPALTSLSEGQLGNGSLADDEPDIVEESRDSG